MTSDLRIPGLPGGLCLTVLVLALAACGPAEQPPTAADQPAESPPAEADKGMDPSAMDHSAMDHAAMDHGDHQMTPEQFTELREKIPLYAIYTDEQIMENMGRMPPDWWEVLSPADVQGKVGVLALGHGYTMGGNEQFKEKVTPISKEYPTAVAPGMAMMSASHIQKAVDALTEEHGVQTIVAVPMEIGEETSLYRQWQYIFGLRDEAPYLSVEPVQTEAEIVFTKSPATNPLMADIMRDYALAEVTDPSTARVVIVSHGPETAEENVLEMSILTSQAERIVESSDFGDVQVLSIQDDAVPETRAANKARLRGMIEEASESGREVVVVPMLLTRGGFHARLQKDLDGLDYNFANRGLIEHPAFQVWISEQVSNAAS